MVYEKNETIHTLLWIGADGMHPIQSKFKMISRDIIFYHRHLKGNEVMQRIWPDLLPFFRTMDYADPSDPSFPGMADTVVEFVGPRPGSISRLSGMTLRQQHALISKVRDSIGPKYGQETADAVLVHKKLDPSVEIDDFGAMLLALSVRRAAAKRHQDLPF
jgi:hypothetical protein